MNLLAWLAAAAVLAAIGLGAVAVWMRSVEHEPPAWHVDLRTAERSSSPNDYLVAAPGYTAADPDATGDPEPEPTAFLAALDRIAMAEANTTRLAGSPEDGRITWVQRSGIFAFPDYITAQADADGWALWSRSRFGKSDLGVNEKRVNRWQAAL